MNVDAEELVAAHAIDALPPDEVAAIESMITCDSELAARYAGFRRVAAALADGLAHNAPPLPPDVWNRIALETASPVRRLETNL